MSAYRAERHFRQLLHHVAWLSAEGLRIESPLRRPRKGAETRTLTNRLLELRQLLKLLRPVLDQLLNLLQLPGQELDDLLELLQLLQLHRHQLL